MVLFAVKPVFGAVDCILKSGILPSLDLSPADMNPSLVSVALLISVKLPVFLSVEYFSTIISTDDLFWVKRMGLKYKYFAHSRQKLP